MTHRLQLDSTHVLAVLDRFTRNCDHVIFVWKKVLASDQRSVRLALVRCLVTEAATATVLGVVVCGVVVYGVVVCGGDGGGGGYESDVTSVNGLRHAWLGAVLTFGFLA